MHDIIEYLIPPFTNIYHPTYHITINIQDIYNFNPKSTLFILKDFSIFRREFKKLLIKRLKEQESKTKQNTKYIKDYYLIKDHKDFLSIYEHTEIIFELLNIPYFLYYIPIQNFHNKYFSEHKYILNNKLTQNIRNNSSIISTKGILILDRVEEILRSKMFNCINDKCKEKSKFLSVFENGKSSVYFLKEEHYYQVIDFDNKCITCKIKLVEDIKNRKIENKYFYFLHDEDKSFRVFSFNNLHGNIYLGILRRSTDSKKLNLEVISSSNTSLKTSDFIKSKSKILSNIEYSEENFKVYIEKYFKLHLCFIDKISDIEITLIVILHFYLLFDCSIAVFTDDYYFISNISKHFFNLYSLDVSFLFELENRRGLYILDINSPLRSNTKEFINKIDFAFKIETNVNQIEFKSSSQKEQVALEFVVFQTEFDLKNNLENLSLKFFNKKISTNRLLKTLVSIRLVLTNIFRKQFCDEIDVFIEQLFFERIV